MDTEKLTREQVQAFSDAVYEKVKKADGSATLFEGPARKSAKEFFEDVKYHLGNILGVYIWGYEYVEPAHEAGT